ncbi:MAG: hypothetical protein Kow002_02160 [Anaerolineales bacterium]
MQSKNRFLFFGLAGILAALLLSVSANPVSGSGLAEPDSETPLSNYPLSASDQTSDCISLLEEAAQQAGLEGYTEKHNNSLGGCYIKVTTYTYTAEIYLEIYPTNWSVSECGEPFEGDGEHIIFHGYPAYTTQGKSGFGMTERFDGKMYKGGRCYGFQVNHYVFDVRDGLAPDSLPFAEALWSVAEKRLPLSEESIDGAEEPFPGDPGEDAPDDFEAPPDPTMPDDFESPTDPTMPDDFEVPPDQTMPTDPADTDSPSDLPLPIVLGSLGIPVIGAIAGTVLSTIVSGFASAAASSTAGSSAAASAPPATTTASQIGTMESDSPRIGSTREDGMVWSPRPWDEAGPGYVPKDEYLRTKDFLDKGYKWTNGGWRAPEQIRQNEQWAKNDRDAVAREDAEWREKWEREREALKQNKAELEKKAKELQAVEDQLNLLDMEDDFNAIQQGLEEEKIYVLNPYQGDPTLVVHGTIKAKNMVWDNTVGRLTGDQGLTCEGYVEKTKEKVIASVKKRFPGAKVQNMLFMEESSLNRTKSVANFLDSINDDNHNLYRIVLPDGSEWALDFHQHKAGNSPLLRPWAEARTEWKEYMGEKEFLEIVRHTYHTTPTPDL